MARGKEIWFLVIEIETILTKRTAWNIQHVFRIVQQNTAFSITSAIIVGESTISHSEYDCRRLLMLCTFSHCNYDVRLHRINYRGTKFVTNFTRQHLAAPRRYSNFKWFNSDFKNLMRFVYSDTPITSSWWKLSIFTTHGIHTPSRSVQCFGIKCNSK